MSWRPALRIARRDALRARGRSALIVAMIALPVLGIGGLDVLLRSAQLDPDERLERELGQTQARLTVIGGSRVWQAPDPEADGAASDGAPSEQTSLASALPGYRILVSREGTLTLRTAAGQGPLQVNEIAVGDPALAGKFDLLEGRAPRAKGEVALTPAALERLGTEIGGSAQVVGAKRSLRVVGIVESTGARDAETVWAPPGTLLPKDALLDGLPPTVYLAGGRPVSWDDVLRLNAKGVLVLSRAVVLDPPPRSEVPYFTEGYAIDTGDQTLITVLGVILIVTLAVLEVVLLAGAAFAVGARRQARSLGLLSAAGGEPGDVRRVVLAGGVVLGLSGAILGLALGLALAAVAMPLLERFSGTEFGHYDVRPLELAGAALVGLVAALLAAVLPARAAARRDPVETLTGRRGQVRTPKRVPAIGLAVTALGVVAAGLGSIVAVTKAAGINPVGGGSATLAAVLIAGGAALTQLGLIVCSPAIVGLAGRWSRRLPLPLRLALTDAARHRARSAPAVAAVLAAVTGATAVALVVTALDARDRQNHLPTWPTGTAGLELQTDVTGPNGETRPATLDAQQILAAVRPELPPFSAHEIRGTPYCTDPDGNCASTLPLLPKENECPLWQLSAPSAADRAAANEDWRCDPSRQYRGGHLPGTPTGGAELLRLLAGRAPAEALDMLRAGGAVVLAREYARNGTLTVEVMPATGGQSKRVRLPAVTLDVPNPPVVAIYGERASARLGLEAFPTHLLLSFDRLPTAEQEDAARLALRTSGLESAANTFGVERGYESDYGLGLLALVVGAGIITLGAAGIATGLAQADARADHATLAAIGATPTLRRTLASSQALAVAGLGTVLGVLAGLVPSLAFIAAIDSLELSVPWLTLLEVLVGIPLLAGACAWLLTRSRLPLERRVAA